MRIDMPDSDQIHVTSHVGRDLLQSAALFKHEHSVVWEYVANGLEYIDRGTKPVVKVRTDAKRKKISIADNGRGMAWKDLQNFFVMHGENIDRKQGRSGRGMFGTGKSAALGIANVLRVTTVKDKMRSVVELHSADVKTMTSADDVPVRTLEREQATDLNNGTLIEIEEINLKKISPNSIIKHIERHIAHWAGAKVFVNHHECLFMDPPVAQEQVVSSVGTPFYDDIGAVDLIIKVAKAPLERDLQGIAILSNEVWHETTLAGIEGKSFANYIFGEIDVPNLQAQESPIAAFDMSRSMVLNIRNPVVSSIYGFIGSYAEKVRLELESADKERRDQDQMRRLRKEADAIANIINSDFHEWRDRIKQMSARMSGNVDLLPEKSLETAGVNGLIFGGDIVAEIVEETGGPGHGDSGNGHGSVPPNAAPQVESGTPESPNQGQEIPQEDRKKRPRGGFAVDFRNMGEEDARAKYERDHRTIFVNLDHPQIAAAAGHSDTDDPTFRRLAYEVAFAEYAIALAQEMAATDYYLDPTDPIFDIRDTLNRVARAAASLYA
jgi:hypothetical protein